MKDKKTRLTVNLKPGRKITHGGFSYLTTGKLPKHRKTIEKYLTAVRMTLIQDLGPTEADLTGAQLIIIGRVISKLGVISCIEQYISENSVMVKDNIAPALKQWYLSYNSSVRKDLQLLGIDKRQAEDKVLTPLEIAAEFDKKKEAEEKAKK